MIESRKQAVSIRMSGTDIRNVKKLAKRIGVRDSDVIRFAVKCMLAKLGPLYDLEAKGRSLVPVFVESGAELLRFFDLDAARLEAIINDGAESGKKVERRDIALLAQSGGYESYVSLMLSELKQHESGTAPAADARLRQYLYDKYVYRGDAEQHAATEPVRMNGAGAHHD